MKETDQQLVTQCQQGNGRAAGTMVDRYYQRLYAFHRRQTLNDHDAADLTQKTFAKLWDSLGTYRGSKSFTAWIFRIAQNTYVDWVRQTTRQNERETRWWEIQPDQSTPFSEMQDHEDTKLLLEIIDLLPEELKQTIQLRYFDQLTLTETGAVLEISITTVKNRLRKALTILREKALDLLKQP